MIWIQSTEEFPWILIDRTHLSPHFSKPVLVMFASPPGPRYALFATPSHPEAHTGAATPDSRVNRPPERTDPLRSSRSSTFALSISTSAAVIDNGDPSVGNLTSEVPSGWAI